MHDRTDELLVRSGTELVCLCGWLRKFRVVASATASTRVDAPGTIAASEPRGAATGDHAGSGSRPRAARLAAPRVDWTMRAMNIHPSLLPAFGGVGMHGDRVHAAVLASGATHSGCTVHYVDDQYDHGPIVVQRVVPVLPGDDVAALAARVFAEERIAYPEAIRMHIAGAACPARA
ncbi:MAG: formyltransferase family protein [Phycisphaerales bacterium]